MKKLMVGMCILVFSLPAYSQAASSQNLRDLQASAISTYRGKADWDKLTEIIGLIDREFGTTVLGDVPGASFASDLIGHLDFDKQAFAESLKPYILKKSDEERVSNEILFSFIGTSTHPRLVWNERLLFPSYKFSQGAIVGFLPSPMYSYYANKNQYSGQVPYSSGIEQLIFIMALYQKVFGDNYEYMPLRYGYIASIFADALGELFTPVIYADETALFSYERSMNEATHRPEIATLIKSSPQTFIEKRFAGHKRADSIIVSLRTNEGVSLANYFGLKNGDDDFIIGNGEIEKYMKSSAPWVLKFHFAFKAACAQKMSIDAYSGFISTWTLQLTAKGNNAAGFKFDPRIFALIAMTRGVLTSPQETGDGFVNYLRPLLSGLGWTMVFDKAAKAARITCPAIPAAQTLSLAFISGEERSTEDQSGSYTKSGDKTEYFTNSSEPGTGTTLYSDFATHFGKALDFDVLVRTIHDVLIKTSSLKSQQFDAIMKVLRLYKMEEIKSFDKYTKIDITKKFIEFMRFFQDSFFYSFLNANTGLLGDAHDGIGFKNIISKIFDMFRSNEYYAGLLDIYQSEQEAFDKYMSKQAYGDSRDTKSNPVIVPGGKDA